MYMTAVCLYFMAHLGELGRRYFGLKEPLPTIFNNKENAKGKDNKQKNQGSYVRYIHYIFPLLKKKTETGF